jgi:predicted AAA+ superfamily ATPase
LQVFDAALMTAMSGDEPAKLLDAPDQRARLTESARLSVAHLANAEATGRCRLFYWREGNREVDFVVERAGELLAVEVKSGTTPRRVAGRRARSSRCVPRTKPLLVARRTA